MSSFPLFEREHTFSSVSLQQHPLLYPPNNSNAQNDLGINALMEAILERNTPAVLALLEKGADPTQKDMYGGSSLLYACGASNVDVFTAVLEQALVQLDGDYSLALNAADQYGNTCLHKSAMSGSVEIVERIMRLNEAEGGFLDLSAENEQGNTASQLAKGLGDKAIVEALGNAGKAGDKEEL